MYRLVCENAEIAVTAVIFLSFLRIFLSIAVISRYFLSFSIVFAKMSSFFVISSHPGSQDPTFLVREGVQKNRFFLGKSPKLWVGGGQES